MAFVQLADQASGDEAKQADQEEEQQHPANPAAFISDVDVPVVIRDNDKPWLALGVKIIKLKDVNHLAGTFTARMALHFQWKDPKNVGKPKGTLLGARFGEADISKLADIEELCPLPRFENVSGELCFDADQSLRPTTRDTKGTTELMLTFTGTFYTEMHLQAFPLDVQLLQVVIRMPHGRDRCPIGKLKMDEQGNEVVLDEGIMLLDWSLRQPFVNLEYPAQIKRGKRQPPKPQFRVVIPIQRQHNHHLLHIVSVLFLLVTGNFAMFIVPLENLADRLSIVLTLFLTVIALKFLVGEKLPAVPFLTAIDQYMLGCLTAFFLVMTEAPAAAAWLAHNDGANRDAVAAFDTAFMWGWLGLWVLFNAGMAISSCVILAQNNRRFPPVVLKAGQHMASALLAHQQLTAALTRTMSRGRGRG